MKKIQKEKGITLIALIISVVILIILAAVVIFDNDAIIAHAKNEADKYNKAQAGANKNMADHIEYLKNEMNYTGNCDCQNHLEESYTSNGDGTHKYKLYCTECDTVLAERNETCSDDGDGYCNYCRGKAACPHQDTEYQCWDINLDIHYWKKVCIVCHEIVDSGSSSTYCPECGHVEETDCSHDNTEYQCWDISSSNHEWEIVCTDCQEILERGTTNSDCPSCGELYCGCRTGWMD